MTPERGALNDDDIKKDFERRYARIDMMARRGDENMRWYFRCAETLYWQLRRQHRFEDLGAADADTDLDLTDSARVRHAQTDRNVIRFVRFPSGNGFGPLRVLKCSAPWAAVSSPAPYESLHAWRIRRLPCVEPIDGGVTEVSVDGLWQRVEFLVMEFVDGHKLSADRPCDNSDEHQLAVIARLTDFIRQFHLSGATIERPLTWGDYWFTSLDAASRFLASDHPDLGWSVPFGSYDAWREEIEVLSAGDVLLHGNCRGANVLVRSVSREWEDLVLVDPIGGIVARREWEMGIGCAVEISRPEQLPSALDAVIEEDRRFTSLSNSPLSPLDPGVLAYAAGTVAVFRAANSVTTGVNECMPPIEGAREWIRMARWAMSSAWKASHPY